MSGVCPSTLRWPEGPYNSHPHMPSAARSVQSVRLEFSATVLPLILHHLHSVHSDYVHTVVSGILCRSILQGRPVIIAVTNIRMLHPASNVVVNCQCVVPSFTSPAGCLPLHVSELQHEVTSMSNSRDIVGSGSMTHDASPLPTVDRPRITPLVGTMTDNRAGDGRCEKISGPLNHAPNEVHRSQQVSLKGRPVTGYSKRRRSSVDLQALHSGIQRHYRRSTRSSSPSLACTMQVSDRSVPSVCDSPSAQSSPEEFGLVSHDAHLNMKSRSLDVNVAGDIILTHPLDDSGLPMRIGDRPEATRQDSSEAMLEEQEIPVTACYRCGGDSDGAAQRTDADSMSLECQGMLCDGQTAISHPEDPSLRVQQPVHSPRFPHSDSDGMVRDTPGKADGSEGSWDIRVDVTLAHAKGQRWGSCDVIGCMDVDSTGEFLATGGIARKVRVYSLTSLRAAAVEESDESVDGDLEDCFRPSRDHSASASDLMGGQGYIPRPDGSGMKRKATSTSDLLRLDEEAARRGSLAGGLVLDPDDNCLKMLCCAAKLSSVQWVPPHLCSTRSRVACGDYDGVFAEWDLTTGLCVLERDEHGGKRIWSTDFSTAHPLAASAGDDGCVRLWSGNSEDSVAVVKGCGDGKSGAVSVCSVKFGPQGSAGEHLLAFAGSDARVHLYDIRHLSTSLTSFRGHQRTVSFVRFLDASTLVTSSIDSTVRVWDVSSSFPASGTGSGHAGSPGASLLPDTPPLLATCADHVNRRNFVGLSVRRVRDKGAVIVTGSETNDIAMYRLNQQHSVLSSWMVDFASGQAQATAEWKHGEDRGVDGSIRVPFVSSVCWNDGQDSLVAANSDGTVRIMSARAV